MTQSATTFEEFKLCDEGRVKDVFREKDGSVTVVLGCGATSTGFPVTEDDLQTMVTAIQKETFTARTGVE